MSYAASPIALPAPFRGRGAHITVELPGVTALFTTRRGGTSLGPYRSMNLGRLTDDLPSAVEANRARLAADTGAELAYIRQVHGTRVLSTSASPMGDGPVDSLEPADGLVTQTRGLAPVVLTADCLPVVISAGGALAVLHAGWRGLAGGIIAAGAAALREMGAEAPSAAAIGPGAGSCCYEVGEEVHARFRPLGPSVRRGDRLDLKAAARLLLEREGIEVWDVGLCTICSDPALFFSHRRDHGSTGRQAGLAWLS